MEAPAGAVARGAFDRVVCTGDSAAARQQLGYDGTAAHFLASPISVQLGAEDTSKLQFRFNLEHPAAGAKIFPLQQPGPNTAVILDSEERDAAAPAEAVSIAASGRFLYVLFSNSMARVLDLDRPVDVVDSQAARSEYLLPAPKLGASTRERAVAIEGDGTGGDGVSVLTSGNYINRVGPEEGSISLAVGGANGVNVTVTFSNNDWYRSSLSTISDLGLQGTFHSRPRVRKSVCTRSHCAAVLSNGNVRMWGSGEDYKLGNALLSPVPLTSSFELVFSALDMPATPQSANATSGSGVAPFSTADLMAPEMACASVVSAALGSRFSLFLLDDGRVAIAGYFPYDILTGTGNGPLPPELHSPYSFVNLRGEPTPEAIPDRVVSMSAGSAHFCLLYASGTVMCSGANTHGQLGAFGRMLNPLTAVMTGPFPADPIIRIKCGANSTVLVLESGTVRYAGFLSPTRTFNALSNPMTLPSTQGIADKVVMAVPGLNFLCTLHASGAVYCMGDRFPEAASPVASPIRSTSPGAVQSLPAARRIQLREQSPATDRIWDLHVSSTSAHTCVTINRATGPNAGLKTPVCFGESSATGPALPQLVVPHVVDLPDATTMEHMAVGDQYTLILLSNGTLLGSGTAFGIPLPNLGFQAIRTPLPVTRIFTGGFGYCFQTSNGSLFCISSMFIGAGRTPSFIPVDLRESEPVVVEQVAAGRGGTPLLCVLLRFTSLTALNRKRFVKCEGASEETGLNVTTAVLLPVPIALDQDEDIQQLSVGARHIGLLTTTGRVKLWGIGTDGQLGNGLNRGTLPATTPYLDLSSLAQAGRVTQISCGEATTLLVFSNGVAFGVGQAGAGQLGINMTATASVDMTAIQGTFSRPVGTLFFPEGATEKWEFLGSNFIGIRNAEIVFAVGGYPTIGLDVGPVSNIATPYLGSTGTLRLHSQAISERLFSSLVRFGVTSLWCNKCFLLPTGTPRGKEFRNISQLVIYNAAWPACHEYNGLDKLFPSLSSLRRLRMALDLNLCTTAISTNTLSSLLAPQLLESVQTQACPQYWADLGMVSGVVKLPSLAKKRIMVCDGCAPGKYCSSLFAYDCPAGTFNSGFRSSSILDCEQCPQGTFSSQGAQSCTPCSPGLYNDGMGSSVCKRCPVGTYQPNFNSTDCLDAPIGHFVSAGGSTSAQPCAPGTYANDTGLASCLPCPQGTYSTDLAARTIDSCKECNLGYYQDWTGQSSCTSCPPGTRGVMKRGSNMTETCRACEPGTFSSGLASRRCLPCDAGSYSSDYGADACVSCPPGTASATLFAKNNNTCVACSGGFYAPFAGSRTCLSCPAGTAANMSLSSDTLRVTEEVSCAVCPAGMYSLPGSPECIECPAGQYNPLPGQSECRPCPFNTFRTAATEASDLRFCLQCPEGKITLFEGATTVKSCTAGDFTCPAGQQPTGKAHSCALVQCDAFGLGLRSSSDGSFCEGCPAGTAGVLPSGCRNCSSMEHCPGLTGRPIPAPYRLATASRQSIQTFLKESHEQATNQSGRRLAGNVAVDATTTCDFLSVVMSGERIETVVPSAARSFAYGKEIIVVCVFGGIGILLLAISYIQGPCTNRCRARISWIFRTIDAFRLFHLYKEGEYVQSRSTDVGGGCTLIGICTVFALAAALIVQRFNNNELEQQSIAPIRMETLDTSKSMNVRMAPPVADAYLSKVLPGSMSGLHIVIAAAGESVNSCHPAAWSHSGLSSGQFIFSADRTGSCGAWTLLHFACSDCLFTEGSSMNVTFPWHCQSLVMRGLSVASDGSIKQVDIASYPQTTGSTNLQPNGALLQRIDVGVSPMLEIRNNSLTKSSTRGYQLLPAHSTGTYAAPLVPASGQSSLIQPLASNVSVRISFSPPQLFISVQISEKQTVLELISSIIGLTAIFSVFGILFKLTERFGLTSSKDTPIGKRSNDDVKAAPTNSILQRADQSTRQSTLTPGTPDHDIVVDKLNPCYPAPLHGLVHESSRRNAAFIHS
jgi:alpha-tubulin suppressor-like RCC1 family protein